MAKPQAKVLGTVSDYRGSEWCYTRSEPVRDFMIHYGFPKGESRLKKAWVMTQNLVNMYHEYNVRGKMATMQHEVPFSDSTVHHHRRQLGLTRPRSRRAWWELRKNDLQELSQVEFVAKHNVSIGSIERWKSILGVKKLRKQFWWRDDPHARFIFAQVDIPMEVLIKHFNLSPPEVSRIRAELRKLGDPIPRYAALGATPIARNGFSGQVGMAMAAMKLKRTDIAERTKISRGSLGQFFNGSESLSAKHLAEIAAAVGMEWRLAMPMPVEKADAE